MVALIFRDTIESYADELVSSKTLNGLAIYRREMMHGQADKFHQSVCEKGDKFLSNQGDSINFQKL